jgi:cytochrome oxidase Cu insertion factor (SCO1/SenC/PrrC family)
MAEKKKVKPSKESARVKMKAEPKTARSAPKKETRGSRIKVAPINKAISLSSGGNIFILGIVLVSVFILAWKNYIGPKYFSEYRALDGGQRVQVQNVGLPQIGGPFVLVNQDGKTVSEADFKGKYMLIYFGFTYCPDVCPTSLTTMGDALDILGDKAENITPVFITVDPERDDPEALKMYVEYFHPRLVGLTGSVDQVTAAAKSYKAYFSKFGDGYGDDDYTMDHSSITYLMAPDGKFVTHFGHGVEAEPMAEKLLEVLK